MRVAVCQLGARMHYAVPRLLHGAGCLDQLYTDLYVPRPFERFLGRLPKILRPNALERFRARSAPDLPNQLVTSFPLFGFEYARRLARAGTPEELDRAFLWAGKAFGNRIANRGLRGADTIYAFNTAALEVMQHGRRKGMRAVVEQTIAPRAVEDSLIAEERAAHPGWEPGLELNELGRETASREAAEWDVADLIVCASEFVKESIGRAGGPLHKCRVVPYGVDGPPTSKTERNVDGRLRVLTVGHVGLRKGAPYAYEVANQLHDVAELRWVGPVNLCAEKAEEMRHFVDLHGPVPRQAIASELAWADVFFLPTICEGSATVVYEAMAAGLPVVTTSHAGSPIRDGVDGFIVPIRDVYAMTERLSALHRDGQMRMSMGRAAASNAAAWSLASYGDRLLAALRNSGAEVSNK